MDAYGRTWGRWDVPAFVDLFTEDVLYFAHPTEESVVGRAALEAYLRKEAVEQGEVRVRMGDPVVESDRVAAEFWVTTTSASGDATIAGSFIARIGRDGRCFLFREYWFDVDGHIDPYDGWGG